MKIKLVIKVDRGQSDLAAPVKVVTARFAGEKTRNERSTEREEAPRTATGGGQKVIDYLLDGLGTPLTESRIEKFVACLHSFSQLLSTRGGDSGEGLSREQAKERLIDELCSRTSFDRRFFAKLLRIDTGKLEEIFSSVTDRSSLLRHWTPQRSREETVVRALLTYLGKPRSEERIDLLVDLFDPEKGRPELFSRLSSSRCEESEGLEEAGALLLEKLQSRYGAALFEKLAEIDFAGDVERQVLSLFPGAADDAPEPTGGLSPEELVDVVKDVLNGNEEKARDFLISRVGIPEVCLDSLTSLLGAIGQEVCSSLRQGVGTPVPSPRPRYSE